jgi:hypothetical protein
MTANETHFCMCPNLDDNLSEEDKLVLQQTRGAILNGAKWNPGETIKIRFLDGDVSLQERVKEVALEWTQFANLNLVFVEQAPAPIRIAFEQGQGSWSYLGTQCRQIKEPEPTMNYGWLTPSSTDEELRKVVLHEFGHALGLIHEHQNPQGGIKWNEAAVINDLSGPPNNWNEQQIRDNMFAKYEGVTATNVDSESIMLYPVPMSWTLPDESGKQFSSDTNSVLSNVDKDFIRQCYS